ncbi:chemotaxis-specific protein-glutamate methyltransferase CheB [Sphingomonas sp. ZT3P38]|uniref:chemotaxis-specific protein-glutamate methyltransferase CheB n=1 Tax=Parasphingomonas zepuensis TaxID=3096161 RepID=UPI002FCAECF0
MIKLLVVDDSPLMRRLLTTVFTEAGDFEVAVARDGAEAIAQLNAFRPDVITLDVTMPMMDGLACLDRIMVERPTPVVMVSALTEKGANETLEALALGAIDFIAKPGGAMSLAIDALAPILVSKVRDASTARLSRASRLAERVRLRHGASLASAPAAQSRQRPAPPRPRKIRKAPAEPGVVLVGTSTGGPPALEALLTPLPADFPWPIVIAQHMPATFTGPLARRLDGICALHVVEVSRPVLLEPGHAYIGRGDADLVLTRRTGGLSAMAAPSSPEFHWHPSVDRMVESALALLGPEQLVGVLMTGMGSDGATTMKKLHDAGGRTIAESEESAVVWGMPGSLVRLGGAGRIAALDDIPDALIAALQPR